MDFFGINDLSHDIYEKIPFEEIIETDTSIIINNENTLSIIDNNIFNSHPKTLYEENKKINEKKKYNLKLFICFCGKIYRSKENLILHFKNIHLGKKPYKCEFCNCSFSHRNGKLYHVRKFHTKIFPYKCPFKDSKLNFFNFFFFSV
jgi:hypothetical protein